MRTHDGFVENFRPSLLACIEKDAPAVRLRFLPKRDKEPGPLYDGLAELETAVVHSSRIILQTTYAARRRID